MFGMEVWGRNRQKWTESDKGMTVTDTDRKRLAVTNRIKEADKN
jgi:hypothetical protein